MLIGQEGLGGGLNRITGRVVLRTKVFGRGFHFHVEDTLPRALDLLLLCFTLGLCSILAPLLHLTLSPKLNHFSQNTIQDSIELPQPQPPPIIQRNNQQHHVPNLQSTIASLDALDLHVGQIRAVRLPTAK